MKKFILTTLSLLVLSSTPALANHTEDGSGHNVAVHVNGLVCDFCAQSITLLFKKQESVVDVHVDLDHGMITLDLKDQQTISNETINQIITDSGFTVVEIKHQDI